MKHARSLLLFTLIIVLAGCGNTTPLKLVRVKEYPYEQRFVIAVVDFQNASGDPENDAYVNGIASGIIQELLTYGRFRIVERERLQQVLDELDLAQTGLIDARSRKKVGHLLGVDALLVGDLKAVSHEEDRQGVGIMAYTQTRKSEIVINARLIAVETGEILASSENSAFFRQGRSSAFGIKSGSFQSDDSAVQTAMNVALKQLANDLAARTPAKQ